VTGQNRQSPTQHFPWQVLQVGRFGGILRSEVLGAGAAALRAPPSTVMSEATLDGE
jgi:hypothetical protein